MRLPERLPRENGRDYALRAIKENIILLELPPGMLISETALSSELGISRTPVREALIELSRAQIVIIQPQKRTVVAPINGELVDEAQFMRNVMECAVVKLDCAMAKPEDIRELDANVTMQRFYLENSEPEQLLALDDAFHRKLFAIAQKTQIFEMIRTISIHFDRVRRMSLDSVSDLKIVEDHAEIIRAIQRGHAEEAQRVMQKHLNRYKVDMVEIRAKYPQYFVSL